MTSDSETLQAAPFDRGTLIQALSEAERAVAEFFASLSAEELVVRVESAWTPAEHLEHLNTATSAVARGFAMSPWLLRLRFGWTRRPSRRYEQLREEYLARLAAGAGASGRFIPRREDHTSEQAAASQAERLARWKRVNARLRAALESWSERGLDRTRLEHPILGRITAREMVFFTIYHGHHHVARAKSRLPRFNRANPADNERNREVAP
jgi:hypothetical protein